MLIRRCVGADRDALAAVVSSDQTFRQDEIQVALELIDAGLAGSADYRLLACESDGRIVGYVCFGPTPMTRATWDLYWVVVDASARGRGVAPTLLTAMEGAVQAEGGKQIRVETSETEGYGAARRLYAKLAYPEAVRLPDFYGPGDALLIYYKGV